ncbi:MAG: hypothetical protein JF591_22045, partial [Lysobacter sp.]|nr:hypothetical protein [Lysobacter sp.]
TAIAALVFALLGNASAHEPALPAARDDAADGGMVTNETMLARDCAG